MCDFAKTDRKYSEHQMDSKKGFILAAVIYA